MLFAAKLCLTVSLGITSALAALSCCVAFYDYSKSARARERQHNARWAFASGISFWLFCGLLFWLWS